MNFDVQGGGDHIRYVVGLTIDKSVLDQVSSGQPTKLNLRISSRTPKIKLIFQIS